MTNHPEDLLTEYVDGTLGPQDRARVEAHLAECAICSEEIAAAREVRTALATLPEREEPAGLAFRAIKESRRRPARPWATRFAAAGAAAVVIGGLIAFVAFFGAGGDGGGDDAGAPAAEAPVEEEAGEPGAAQAEDAARATLAALDYPRLREADEPVDAASLSSLARSLRDEARDALSAGLPGDAVTFYDAFDVETLPPRSADALACVTDAFTPDRSVVPFVILEGSFEGEPAYIASFLQGPAPEEAYDRVVMIVAGRSDCALRTLASQRL